MRTNSSVLPTAMYTFPVLLLLAMMYYKVFLGMGHTWSSDANYSHGFLIPIISGYIFWLKKDPIRSCRRESSILGIPVLLLGLALYVFGSIGGAYTSLRISFFIVLYGIVLYLFGKSVFLEVLFPVSYMLFMVPLPSYLYDSIAFPLKTFVAHISVEFIQYLRFPVYLDGNIIIFPDIRMEVADACSGIRSLYSILAVAVAYAYFLDVKPLKRFFLVISVVPIAILANAIRVVSSAILYRYFGPAILTGALHDISGLLVFLIMLSVLFTIGYLMKK